MIAVLQRVSESSVSIDGNIKSAIQTGLMVLLGIEEADEMEDVEWICKKTAHMRIFPDEKGVMNRSILEVEGDMLVISQFTLHASTKKGNRPSYIKAAKPEKAIHLYDSCIKNL
jgi:D-tyrosyl-tRNA(Tyr) deacylase